MNWTTTFASLMLTYWTSPHARLWSSQLLHEPTLPKDRSDPGKQPHYHPLPAILYPRLFRLPNLRMPRPYLTSPIRPFTRNMLPHTRHAMWQLIPIHARFPQRSKLKIISIPAPPPHIIPRVTNAIGSRKTIPQPFLPLITTKQALLIRAPGSLLKRFTLRLGHPDSLYDAFATLGEVGKRPSRREMRRGGGVHVVRVVAGGGDGEGS